MNYQMIGYLICQILRIEGVLMLPALLYADSAFWAILATAVGLIVLGTLTTLVKPKDTTIGSKDGLVVCGLSWLFLSVFGALPFVFSGAIPNFIDALFEATSGFTTTGATILREVESVDRGLLFWRSFTHWIGGMGALVFMLAVLPKSEIKSTRMMYVLRAEMPGPKVGKVTAKLRQTALIMYYIYLALTAIMIVILLLGGLDLFDTLTTTFGTAGTGGFSVKNTSIGAYNSPFAEYVIAIFMFLFSINFNLYFLIVTGHVMQALRSEELRWFTIIVFAAVGLICYDIYSISSNFEEAFRDSFFQVTSIISTSGFSTTNFDLWPPLSRAVLVLLMFIGACAGSTGGGLKVGRIVLLIKSAFREIKHALSPRSVVCVSFERKTAEPELLRSSSNYFIIYALLFVSSLFAVLIADGKDLLSSFTGVVTCLNNVGPGLGLCGPFGSFADFTYVSKLVFTFDMLAGRLELFPILILFLPATWRNRT